MSITHIIESPRGINLGSGDWQCAGWVGIDEVHGQRLKQKNAHLAIEKWYEHCLSTGRYKKWIVDDEEAKDVEKIIKITGHYTFASEFFRDLKGEYLPDYFDDYVKDIHVKKIKKLLSLSSGDII